MKVWIYTCRWIQLYVTLIAKLSKPVLLHFVLSSKLYIPLLKMMYLYIIDRILIAHFIAVIFKNANALTMQCKWNCINNIIIKK